MTFDGDTSAPCPHCSKTLERLDDFAWEEKTVMLIECWHCYRSVDILRKGSSYEAVPGD